jgi:hypothetical protein
MMYIFCLFIVLGHYDVHTYQPGYIYIHLPAGSQNFEITDFDI